MNKTVYIVLLMTISQCLDAQFAAVLSDEDFTRLENDSAVLMTPENLRGILQWQKSTDSLIWTDIEANLAGNSLAFVPEITEVYRLRTIEGTCSPLYSDTIIVFSKNTVIAEYLLTGISIPDLSAAGVSVADLIATGLSVADLIVAGVTVTKLFDAGIMVGTLEQNGADSINLTDAGLIGIIADYDNNSYKWVKIENQIWMAENLKTTKYRDGTAIPNITDSADWGNLTTGAYCDYDNLPTNGTIYGRLYNWHAAVDSRNLCPAGWHVPTHDEWESLNTYLGHGLTAGGKLKETGTTSWSAPNTDATNETGFTALPGGFRSGYKVAFSDLNIMGAWQSATAMDASNSYGACVVYNYGWLATVQGNQENGFSVRCVKD